MEFIYKVQNTNGELLEGTIESSDKFSAARSLKEKGFIPISIFSKEDKNKKSIFKIYIFSKISCSDKIIFTNNLSEMLTAGLSLVRALTILEKQSNNVKFKEIIDSLVDNINEGGTLSEGMKKYPRVFSNLFVSMIRSGEESGSLPKVLNEIGATLKKNYDLNKKIKGAMTYPSVVFSAMILIGILMMVYVVPTLTKTFNDIGEELPSSTKFIILISDYINNHFFWLIIIILSVISLFTFLIKSKITKKYFDYLVIKLPIIGMLTKEVNTARTARTLSSLLSSGVDVSRALSITQDVIQNEHYKIIIKKAIENVEKGVLLSQVFRENTHLYPIMMGEMMEVGEETGNLSKMLTDIANFYEGEVDNKTKNLSTIIEPALMVIIGAAVGFFAVSMISPMYSVMSNIN